MVHNFVNARCVFCYVIDETYLTRTSMRGGTEFLHYPFRLVRLVTVCCTSNSGIVVNVE